MSCFCWAWVRDWLVNNCCRNGSGLEWDLVAQWGACGFCATHSWSFMLWHISVGSQMLEAYKAPVCEPPGMAGKPLSWHLGHLCQISSRVGASQMLATSTGRGGNLLTLMQKWVLGVWSTSHSFVRGASSASIEEALPLNATGSALRGLQAAAHLLSLQQRDAQADFSLLPHSNSPLWACLMGVSWLWGSCCEKSCATLTCGCFRRLNYFNSLWLECEDVQDAVRILLSSYRNGLSCCSNLPLSPTPTCLSIIFKIKCGV